MSIVEKLDNDDKKAFFTRKKIIALLGLTILVGAILEIWVSNRLATFGTQYTEIERAKNSLTLENQLLEDQIATKESLSRTQKYAELIGFQQVKNIEYIETASGSSNPVTH